MSATPQKSELVQEDSSKEDEQAKEMSLEKKDRIESFNLLTWASLAAVFVSIWQIFIPLHMFTLNFSQLCLGVVSIFFLLVSLGMLYWSHKNYKLLKNDKKQENPVLHTWHIEGFIYVSSFILIVSYFTFFIGIIAEEGYAWALLVAKGADPDTAYKQAIVLVIAQCSLIAADIGILIVYVKYSYHLEFFPKHLPSVLGYFLTSYIVISCFVIGDQDYLKSYIGDLNREFAEESESDHTKIFWTTVVSILLTLFFIFENRSTQLQLVPKVRFYFFPLLAYIVIATYTLQNSLDFIMNASQMNENISSNCKSNLQKYDETFVMSLGCPYKYVRYTQGQQSYFSQDCPTSNIGIVWEMDIGKSVDEKNNLMSCLNLNCCYLVPEQESLKYIDFFLITLLQSLIGFIVIDGFICAGHCLDLALQNPLNIKAGPSTFSSAKFGGQIAFAVLAIVVAGFFTLQYQPYIPVALPEKTDHIYNEKAKNYTLDLSLQSVSACKYVNSLTNQTLQVQFNEKACPKDVQSNLLICNKNVQGFAVCLNGKNGVFQLDPKWDNKAKIDGLKMFDPTLLQQALLGQLTQDKFCAVGLEADINQILSQYLFFCENPNKTPVITMEVEQIQVGTPEKSRVLLRKVMNHEEPHISVQDVQDTQRSHGYVDSPVVLTTPTPQSPPTPPPNPQDFSFVSTNTYGQVNINVYDSQSAAPIGGAQLQLFMNVKSCQLLNDVVNYPIRQVQSDASGNLVINNIQVIAGSQFVVQIKADGYFYNCLELGAIQAGQTISKSVPLVTMIKSDEMLKIQLSYDNDELDLELGVTYNMNSTTSCYAGYYMEFCGELSFAVAYTNPLLGLAKPSQVVTMRRMANANYLVFVKLVPKDKDLKNALNNNLPLTPVQAASLAKLNSQFVSGRVGINVFAQNKIFPVGFYTLSAAGVDITQTKSGLVWLAVCVDGSVGPVSQQALNDFWLDGTKYWQKDPSSTAQLPVASICDDYFEQQQKLGNKIGNAGL